MGEVFLAEDAQLGRKVAIKFLTEELEADATARERLLREARSAAALDHPCICKVFEIAEIDGRTGIVMEHVSGETLEQMLSRSLPDVRRAVELAAEIAEALEAAHRSKLVHRDLKPANVMLTDDGHVKVMDFGLANPLPSDGPPSDGSTTVASLTGSGVRVGTPAYMAPEQLAGGTADARSDIFAFGILLYELLTGVHPFRRSSPSGTLGAILREAPAPVSQYAKGAPETARVALDRLLAKDPRERYQSFGEVRTDLSQILQEASGQAPVQVESVPILASGRTTFVGRDAERAEGRRLLELAIGGHGGLLFLGGEPGVGKTRLAEELLEDGRQRGCLSVVGRCYETEGTPPYIPWVEIVERSARIVPRAAFRAALGDAAPEVARLVPELRRLFPDIPPPIELPPEQQQRYLFNSFLEFFERGARVSPSVILVDDLHWADESTLLLLQHLAQRTAEIPVLFIGTYRDVDLDVERPFAEMLETLTRQRLAQKLALGRLDEVGVSRMLEALSGQTPPPSLATVIFAETEGNPFFTEEVFHHLSEEGRLFDEEGRWRDDLKVGELAVPEGVRLVVGRRLNRLSGPTRRMLTLAAVTGRSFDLGLLEALEDVAGDALLEALEEAEGAKLITAVSSGRELRWEFAHGLIRQTLENSLSLMRRQRAHLRVADAMEALHGAAVDRHAADIGHHLYQAGVAADPERTVRFLALAGDGSLAAGAFDEALRQFDDALSIAEEGDDRRTLADLQFRQGRALKGLGRFEDAVAALEPALATYDALGDLQGVARTAHDMAEQTSWLPGHGGRGARDVARRGLDLVGDRDAGARCRMLALVARFASLAGDPFAESHGALIEAERLAERLGRPDLTADLLTARARFHWSYLQYSDAVEVGRRAVALREERGELYEQVEVWWHGALSALFAGRFAEAIEGFAGIEECAPRAGNVGAQFAARCGREYHHLVADGALDDQRWSRFVAWSEQNAPAFLFVVHIWRGTERFYAGDWPAARQDYEAAVRVDNPSFCDGTASTGGLVGAILAGDDVRERIQVAKAQALALVGENPAGSWELLSNVVEALAESGAGAAAADLYEAVTEALTKGAVVGLSNFRLWQMVAGIAAACGEQWTMAQEHFETSLRQAHELPHVIAQPETRRWYARMLLDRDQPGDRDKARALLGEAIEQYKRIGMPKHVAMATDMLKALS